MTRRRAGLRLVSGASAAALLGLLCSCTGSSGAGPAPTSSGASTSSGSPASATPTCTTLRSAGESLSVGLTTAWKADVPPSDASKYRITPAADFILGLQADRTRTATVSVLATTDTHQQTPAQVTNSIAGALQIERGRLGAVPLSAAQLAMTPATVAGTPGFTGSFVDSSSKSPAAGDWTWWAVVSGDVVFVTVLVDGAPDPSRAAIVLDGLSATPCPT